MPNIFESRFAPLATFSLAYVGTVNDFTFVLPGAVIGDVLLAGGETASALDTAWAFSPGAGYEGLATPLPAAAPIADAPAEDWMHRGDFTDIGIGGGAEGFYLVSGDLSFSTF